MPRPIAHPSASDPGEAAHTPTPALAELADEDFYYEGASLVFTAAYHLKRGFCCTSDCRHCPYREPA